VIDLYTTIGYLLKLSLAQRISYVPAHARQDDFNRKMQPLENTPQHFVHRFLIRLH